MRTPLSQPEFSLPRGSRRRQGFTAVAAALTVLLIACFIALAIGVMLTSGGGARRATCTKQLKDLVAALNMYRAERGGYPPASYQAADPATGAPVVTTWADLIHPYLSRTELLSCRGSKPAASSGAEREPASAYWYVRGETLLPDAAPVNHRPSALPSTIDLDKVAKHHVLLVCRAHDLSPEPDRTRVLIAYEDGTVRWERLPSYLAPRKPPARTPQPNRNDW